MNDIRTLYTCSFIHKGRYIARQTPHGVMQQCGWVLHGMDLKPLASYALCARPQANWMAMAIGPLYRYESHALTHVATSISTVHTLRSCGFPHLPFTFLPIRPPRIECHEVTNRSVDAVPHQPHPPTRSMMTVYPGHDLSIEQLVSALTKAVITDNGLLER